LVLAAAGALVLAGCLPIVAPPKAETTTTSTSTTTTTTTDPVVSFSPPKVYPPCPATTGTPAQVVLYGDSLVYQSEQDFASPVCTSDVQVATYGQPGAALCDFTSFIATQTAADPPAIAVIAFSGNNDTSCMEDAHGAPLVGAALLAKYKADAEWVMSLFTPGQTKVLWVTPPGRVGDNQEPALAAVYQQVVSEYPNMAMLVDGGKYLRDATGTYQLNLPCWPDEQTLTSCQAGQIQVRLQVDGFHFCPVLIASGPCPVYDAGAVRYGRAMAEPVEQLLGS
jgi:hypothetical protein